MASLIPLLLYTSTSKEKEQQKQALLEANFASLKIRLRIYFQT
jgi:hypothetical protein